MSKAEDRAQAFYPAWENGIGDEFSQNSAYYGFIEGYHQAEKDLELTWEDIRDILKIYETFTWKKEWVKHKTLADGYQEILKRFKEKKK